MINVQLEKDEKLIQLIAKQVTAKNGSKFTAFSAVQKDKRLMDCKFINDINTKPVESCYIRVKIADINVDRNRLYPVLWVRNILGIYVDDSERAEQQTRSSDEINDLFE